MRAATVVLGVVLSLASTRALHADEPVRETRYDPGAYPPPAARWNLVLGGFGATAAWYGAAVGFSYWFPDAPGAEDLRIPVAGPWMALADTGCADDDPDCSTLIVVLRAILTTVDGVGQAGGLLVMTEGLFLPTRAPAARRRRSAALELRPAPLVTGRDGLGLAVNGKF
jgi:hypothetical protein